MNELAPDTEVKNEAKVKGGKARAQSLTPSERRDIARRAAMSRWAREVADATHDGILRIGAIEIPCANLSDGRRLLSERAVTKAFGGKRGGSHWLRKRASSDGGANLPVFLSANNLRPFVSNELQMALSKPILYRTKSSPAAAYGIEATLLPEMCEVLLKANDANALHPKQLHIAAQANILIRGLANVGIIALVDEATGYQYDRARFALEEILEQFVAKELRKWVKTFPDEFYYQICKLRKWKLADINKRGPIWGNLTNNLVYRRLAPGVLKELKRLTPKDAKGRHKDKLFQRLTEDIGHPRLRELLASEITLMRIFDEGQWDAFMKAVNKAIPVYRDEPLFVELDEPEGLLNGDPLQLPAQSASAS